MYHLTLLQAIASLHKYFKEFKENKNRLLIHGSTEDAKGAALQGVANTKRDCMAKMLFLMSQQQEIVISAKTLCQTSSYGRDMDANLDEISEEMRLYWENNGAGHLLLTNRTMVGASRTLQKLYIADNRPVPEWITQYQP
jgi:hypothetical protein